MPGDDKAMDIHLRLLVEKASEALSRGDVAEQFAEMVAHLEPGIVQELVAADLRRLLAEERDNRPSRDYLAD